MSGDYEPFVAIYDVAVDIMQPTEFVNLDGLHMVIVQTQVPQPYLNLFLLSRHYCQI
jgi:hypothetical protein